MIYIYKYVLSIAGDNFFPDSIIKDIKGNFIIDQVFKPGDKKIYGNDLFEFGGGSFWHPRKFSTGNKIAQYQKDIVDFIEQNYQLFIDNGVERLDIYMEIYSDGGQCNFEIFNKDLLKKLTEFNVSLPISVYVLPEDKLKEWEHKTMLAWESR